MSGNNKGIIDTTQKLHESFSFMCLVSTHFLQLPVFHPLFSGINETMREMAFFCSALCVFRRRHFLTFISWLVLLSSSPSSHLLFWLAFGLLVFAKDRRNAVADSRLSSPKRKRGREKCDWEGSSNSWRLLRDYVYYFECEESGKC